MTLSQSLSVCFKKAFITTGRACRSEFWWTALIYSLFFAGYATFYFYAVVAKEYLMAFPMLLFVPGLLVLWPMMYAVTIRRLQDSGHSGWTQYIALVPMAGWIALLVFLIKRGTPGPNEYGDEPSPEPTYNNLK